MSESDQKLEQLWQAHFEPMVRLARKKLAGRALATHDEEDIALSAMKSFCLGMREGRFTVGDADSNVWPLLARLTLNKAIDRIREQARGKRGGDRQRVRIDEDREEVSFSVTDPSVLAESRECFERLFDTLEENVDRQLSPILVAKLEGQSNDELANRLACSTRTIQRKLALIARIWEAP